MLERPRHYYFVWLLLDAMMGVVIGYLAVREALFWHHDATGFGRWFLYNAGFAGAILGSSWALTKTHAPPTALRLPWRIVAARDVGLVLLVFQLVPTLLVANLGDGHGKGLGFPYVVSDWHQIAQETGSFLTSAPLGAGLMAGLFVVIVFVGLVLERRLIALVAMAGLWSWFVSRTDTVMVENPVLFIILFVPATLCAGVAIAARRPKFSARTLAWACTATFIGLVYLGDLPLGERGGWRDVRGVTQLYPCDEQPHSYPMRFARDIWADAGAERLYLAYGPSSGVVGFDLHTGCQTDHFEANGMIRRLWSAPDQPYLYGADDVTADVYALNKRPVTVAKEVDLFAHDGINDGLTITASPARNRLYVTHYARAAITEMTLDDMAYRRTLDLYEGGFTEIPAAITSMTIGETPEVGYALVGPVDVDRNWRVLAIDLVNMTVTRQGLVPGGTNYIWYSAARKSLWMAGGAVRSLLEVDAATLTVRREVWAPGFSMAFAGVPRHGVLAVAGPVDRELAILCEETGEVVQELLIGPKIMGLHYAPEIDALYAASGEGVFRIDKTLLRCAP